MTATLDIPIGKQDGLLAKRGGAAKLSIWVVHLHCPSDPYDCNAGYSNWQAGWSVGKKGWCCQVKHMGCAGAGASEPYDCNAGYSNWVKGWSVDKKAWCCQHKGRGCTTTPCPTA